MAAGRSYPASEVRAAAKRCYLASKVRGGGREELSCFRGQGRLGEATSLLRPREVTLRSHSKPEARGGSWEEAPMPEARARPGRASQEGLEKLSEDEGQERRL